MLGADWLVRPALEILPAECDWQEGESSFAENAAGKARMLRGFTQACVLADDSGLEVDCLDGRPGVHSQRYAGPRATDLENCAKLLAEMAGLPDEKRSGRCVCALTFVDTDGREYACTGKLEGKIATAPRGGGGFGYDPLFIPLGYELTLAELGAELKNAMSHRRCAVETLKKFIRK